MAKKIFLDGNYLIMQNTETGKEFEGIAKDCRISRVSSTSTSWTISGLKDWTDDVEIDIDDMVDANDEPWDNDDFNAWRKVSTGKSSGGATPTTLIYRANLHSIAPANQTIGPL